ncbi:hypothetical protein [Nonomuraea insulae]|uniref:Uncharacterized protein n=1 Tax=Nonomuraea insulae TaxID=1616787 RepID=A0ABW1D2A8_9ACTN
MTVEKVMTVERATTVEKAVIVEKAVTVCHKTAPRVAHATFGALGTRRHGAVSGPNRVRRRPAEGGKAQDDAL